MEGVAPGSIRTFVRDTYLYRQDADGSVTVDLEHEILARKGDPVLVVGEFGVYVDFLFKGDVFTCKTTVLRNAEEV